LTALQVVGMVMGPTWQGNVYPGSVAALVLTAAVTAVALAGLCLEWRRAVSTARLFNLAVACLLLPVLLVVWTVVAG
jgi:hypothetical protein